MNPRIVVSVVVTIAVVGLLAGVGLAVYDAGLAQGVAQGVTVVAPNANAPGAVAPATAPWSYYGHGGYYRPWWFGFQWLLIPFIVFFMILFFRLVFGSRHRGWGDGRSAWSDQLPPRVEEWHRRLHQEDAERPTT